MRLLHLPHVRLVPVLVLAAVLGGCSGRGRATIDAAIDADDAPPCPIGDPAAPAEIEIVHLDASQQIVPTLDGARVPLVLPPQGGWIILLGVRARNLDACRLTLTTSFRDACQGPILKLDRRPAQLEDTGDGWAISTMTTLGNLPICPQLTALRDLHEQPYDVTVEVEDINGKRASRTVELIPFCPAGNVGCACECDHNYVLGGPCPAVGPDAGVPACPDAGL
jgi:hypothetical protein